ncbi:MAG: AAA family ATPase, partial [bacterium]
MKRTILERLKAWKDGVGRKPLLLQGARQVGKTFILKEFGRTCFGRVHYVNFEEMVRFVSVFSGDLSPTAVIRDISLMLEAPIDRHADLLVLDEIQQCPRALTSL